MDRKKRIEKLEKSLDYFREMIIQQEIKAENEQRKMESSSKKREENKKHIEKLEKNKIDQIKRRVAFKK